MAEYRAVREAVLSAHIGLKTLYIMMMERRGFPEDVAVTAWDRRRQDLQKWVEEIPDPAYP